MIKYLKQEDNFDEIISQNDYLVDFYADWCGPCKMIATVLDTLENVEILKVNVDEFGDVSQKFGVMSIPTLIYIKGGKEVNKLVGFKSKEDIMKMISES